MTEEIRIAHETLEAMKGALTERQYENFKNIIAMADKRETEITLIEGKLNLLDGTLNRLEEKLNQLSDTGKLDVLEAYVKQEPVEAKVG
ncbi:MAG: hypothetical protein WCW53_06935 [Syntrophales bacterium]|jgi:hypothetical protein|nr:hypothetical protein [Syntrophales bacterium]